MGRDEEAESNFSFEHGETRLERRRVVGESHVGFAKLNMNMA